MDDTTSERLMNVDEARALLDCSRRMMYMLAQRGEVPSVRVGRLLKFRKMDLLAWISRNTRGGTS